MASGGQRLVVEPGDRSRDPAAVPPFTFRTPIATVGRWASMGTLEGGQCGGDGVVSRDFAGSFRGEKFGIRVLGPFQTKER